MKGVNGVLVDDAEFALKFGVDGALSVACFPALWLLVRLNFLSGETYRGERLIVVVLFTFDSTYMYMYFLNIQVPSSTIHSQPPTCISPDA